MAQNPNVYAANRDGQPAGAGQATGPYAGYNSLGASMNWGGTFGGLPWLQSLWGDITGQNAEMRGYQMQEYFMDKQNEYNDPSAQMDRLRAAGFTNQQAAQSVLGGSNESAQAPSVAPVGTNGAAAIQGAASLISAGSQANLTASQAELNKANAGKATEEANDLRLTRDARLSLLVNEGAKALEEAGLARGKAFLVATKAVYADMNERIDVIAKLANVDKVNKEIKVLEAEYKRQLKEIDILVEKHKVAEIETWFAQERQNLYQSNGFDMNSPFDMALLEMGSNGHLTDVEDFVFNIESKKAEAQEDVKDRYAYSIGYRRKLGENAADVVNGSVGGAVSLLNRVLNILTAKIDNVAGALGRGTEKLVDDVVGYVKEKKYNAARNVMRDELEQLLTIKQPDEEVMKAIDDLQMVLQLSNSELYDYFVNRSK